MLLILRTCMLLGSLLLLLLWSTLGVHAWRVVQVDVHIDVFDLIYLYLIVIVVAPLVRLLIMTAFLLLLSTARWFGVHK